MTAGDGTMAVVWQMLVNLALTILVEGILIWVWFRRWKFVVFSALVNLLTNPVLNLVLLLVGWRLHLAGYVVVLLVLEALVIAVEAWLYHLRCGWKSGRALWVSGVLNVVSWATGIVLYAFMGRWL